MRGAVAQLRGLKGPAIARRRRALNRRFGRASPFVWPRRTAPFGLAIACALVFSGVFVGGLALPDMPGPIQIAPAKPITASVAVIDGDTVRLPDGDRVRISNIDTPETPPRSRCAEETRLARAATANLAAMVATARDVRLVPDRDRERDVHGRLLGRLVIDGVDVGEAQIAAGLARRWSGRRERWCD